jgi:hypothetical protein
VRGLAQRWDRRELSSRTSTGERLAEIRLSPGKKGRNNLSAQNHKHTSVFTGL